MNTYGNKNEPFRQEAFENTLSNSLSEQNKINIYDPLYLLNRFLNTKTTSLRKDQWLFNHICIASVIGQGKVSLDSWSPLTTIGLELFPAKADSIK